MADYPKYPKYPATFEAFQKSISEGTVSHKVAALDPTLATPSRSILDWDDPRSDPLADLEEMYARYGIPFPPLSKRGGKKVASELEYYTASDVSRHPYLSNCSECGCKRTTRIDPWMMLKPCPNCGHVDEIRPALGWAEVQKFLVGILRQVPDNKVQVHPAEFNTDGLVFKQETDIETGIVTIWFEKFDVASPVTEQCSSFTYSPVAVSGTGLQCNKPSGHPGDHEALDSSWSTVLWPNRAHSVGVMSKCARAMSMANGGKAVCYQPHGHSGNHMGIDSLAHHTISWTDETVTAECTSQFKLAGYGHLICQGKSGHKHPAIKGHPGTKHFAKDPTDPDPSAFLLWD